jgi:DNA repair exonuclease SbcCD ATPase subunit
MVNELKEYDSVNEIVKALDDKINLTKNMLGEYLRRLDEIRALAERSKKVRDVVTKLAGKKAGVESTLGEITVGDLSVVLDANPFQELTAIEEAVKSQQERLLILQKAHDGMKWANQLEEAEGLKFMVLETDGIPARILLKFS